jgi:rhodanese-related sulfurtransferase
VTVLDVRRRSEYAQQHLQGATNIPIHELLSRLDEVPRGEVWVHCASGYRASIAASVLAANDRQVVVIDDDFTEHAAEAGLPLVAATA